MNVSLNASRPVRWHLIEGEEGCEYALAHGCVAIVVDALRASATATMLLDAGATEIEAVREVEEAFAARRAFPEALLFGERGGLPPEGFDFGNSPREVRAAAGRRVIFTTTTGAGRLVACYGCPAVLMGTTVNATAVATAALGEAKDVVVIPAGLAMDPTFDAQEDWVAAAMVVRRAWEAADGAGAGLVIGEGEGRYRAWCERIDGEGILPLFESAPHAAKLRAVGLGDDVAFCAQMDVTEVVPRGARQTEHGVVLQRSGSSVGRR